MPQPGYTPTFYPRFTYIAPRKIARRSLLPTFGRNPSRIVSAADDDSIADTFAACFDGSINASSSNRRRFPNETSFSDAKRFVFAYRLFKLLTRASQAISAGH